MIQLQTLSLPTFQKLHNLRKLVHFLDPRRGHVKLVSLILTKVHDQRESCTITRSSLLTPQLLDQTTKMKRLEGLEFKIRIMEVEDNDLTLKFIPLNMDKTLIFMGFICSAHHAFVPNQAQPHLIDMVTLWSATIHAVA